MPNLTIGRVGLDVDVADPEKIQQSGARQGARQLRFAGALIGATLDETKALRDELLASAELGRVTPVTWTGDASLDGFYRIRSVSVEVRSLNAAGFVPFQVELEQIGTAGDLVFRTKLTGTVAANDHGITEAESAAFHAPPRGHVAYDTGSAVPGSVVRTGSGGAIRTYRDVSFTVDPFWTIAAASSFYNAAVKVSTGATLRERAGLSVANDPGNFRLENELVRVTPNATGGRLDVSHHDGTQWKTEKVWRIQSGGSDVGAWDAMAVLAQHCRRGRGPAHPRRDRRRTRDARPLVEAPARGSSRATSPATPPRPSRSSSPPRRPGRTSPRPQGPGSPRCGRPPTTATGTATSSAAPRRSSQTS